MRKGLGVLLVSWVLTLAQGCGGPGGPAAVSENRPQTASATAAPTAAACSALTSEEIKAVQGEPVQETKGNERTGGGLSTSYCVYVLPTFTNSVSLDLTRNDPAGSDQSGVEKFWAMRFGHHSAQEREREGSGQENREKREEENAEGKPLPVSGVGDGAFWVGSRRKGALYVLKKDVVLIISLGGAEDESAKIRKTSLLAQQAIKRL